MAFWYYELTVLCLLDLKHRIAATVMSRHCLMLTLGKAPYLSPPPGPLWTIIVRQNAFSKGFELQVQFPVGTST